MVSILPIANRCVVFGSGTRSLHGHPRSVAVPDNRRRNSLALYYYTIDRALDADYAGYQADVNWCPTSADDFAFQNQQILDLLASLRDGVGRKIVLPALLMPAELCEASGFGDANYIAMTIVEAGQVPLEIAAPTQSGAGLAADRGTKAHDLRLCATSRVPDNASDPELSCELYVNTVTAKIYGKGNSSPYLYWLGYSDFLPPFL